MDALFLWSSSVTGHPALRLAALATYSWAFRTQLKQTRISSLPTHPRLGCVVCPTGTHIPQYLPFLQNYYTVYNDLFTSKLKYSIINSTRLEWCLVHHSMPKAEKGAYSMFSNIYVLNEWMKIHCLQSTLSITQQNIYFYSTEMENCFLSQSNLWGLCSTVGRTLYAPYLKSYNGLPPQLE